MQQSVLLQHTPGHSSAHTPVLRYRECREKHSCSEI